MARHYVTQIIDDLDGQELTESQVTEVHFSFEGTNYLLEVSEENAAKFRSVLEPYLSAATKETGRTRRRATRNTGTSEATKAYNKAVREWAANNGYQVAPRGQIKKSIIEAYEAAKN